MHLVCSKCNPLSEWIGECEWLRYHQPLVVPGCVCHIFWMSGNELQLLYANTTVTVGACSDRCTMWKRKKERKPLAQTHLLRWCYKPCTPVKIIGIAFGNASNSFGTLSINLGTVCFEELRPYRKRLRKRDKKIWIPTLFLSTHPQSWDCSENELGQFHPLSVSWEVPRYLKFSFLGRGGDIFIVLNCCHVLQRGVFNLILLLSIFCLNRSLARATGCHTTLLNLVKHATSVRRRHCCRVESARLEHLYMCQEGWKVYADIYTSEVYVIQEWKIIIMPTATGLACSMYSMQCFLKKCHTFFLQSCYTSSYSAYFLYNAYSDDYDNDNNILTDA